MSYIINNSRGNIVAVVPDGTVNTSATSLALVGQSLLNYGEFQNENYVYLLENFANNTAPLTPILGQLWYQANTDTLFSYSSTNAWAALATQSYVDAAKISPAFTGVPTAPTAPPGTANTQIATTAFVTSSPQFSGIPTAPTAPSGTATTQLATTAFVTASPQFLGTPTAPTQPYGDNSTKIATTAFVQNEKASPNFTGTPTAPTATQSTNTDQIATTAFVQTKVASSFGTLGTMSTQNANNISVTGGQIYHLDSPVPVDSGGTGANNPTTARTNLGLGSMSVQDANNVAITGGGIINTNITPVSPWGIAQGGTGANNAPAARTNLGLGSISTQDANNVAISGGAIVNTAITLISPLSISQGGTGAANATGARTNLGLGSMALQNSNSVSITGGVISSITPIGISDGGTGSSTASGARTNLGLGSMAVQNANNVAIIGGNIANVTIAANSTILSIVAITSGGTGATTAPQARTNLGLKSMALQDSANVSITGGVITNVQLDPTSLGNLVVPIVNGGTSATSAAGARTNLGLGSMAVQNSNNVNITGGSITGITTLAIADGGTGATTAPNARTNLGAAWTGTTVTAGSGLTGGGSLGSNFTIAIATNSNGYGTRYVSTTTPTGGNDGDIWYQI